MIGEELRIGRVVSVAGSQVIILLEGAGDHQAAGAQAPLQMGQLVKMATPNSTVFGMVSGLSIPIPSADAASKEMKIIEVEMLGESTSQVGNAFRRGVSAFPALGDPVFTATQEDLRQVYARPAVKTVRIGTIHQDRSLPAYVAIDDLLGKHFAVLGTTGSGKSCAVTLILQSILKEHPNGHIVLLDPHNEYAPAFGEGAEVLSPSNLKLPYWLFNFEEITEVILGADDSNRQTGPAEISILSETIPQAKRLFSGKSEDAKYLTVDTPIPYQISDLIQLIDEAMGKLDNPENTAPYMRIKAKLNALRMDSRFSFMFGGLAVRDNMTEILSRIFRVPVNGKPISIMDLSGVPSEILNVVVSVLCRMTFDFALWSDRAVPVVLVCEEAHRYIPQDSKLGFEPTKKALSKIAKEGRKYGVSLGMVSQRPSELAAGILSQCNTIFALRMSNQNDQEFVRSTLSESAVGLLDFLPSLRSGEAIAVGEGVPIPVRICFDRLPAERRPLSGTAPFSSSWQNDSESKDFLAQVVERWRYQRRGPAAPGSGAGNDGQADPVAQEPAAPALADDAWSLASGRQAAAGGAASSSAPSGQSSQYPSAFKKVEGAAPSGSARPAASSASAATQPPRPTAAPVRPAPPVAPREAGPAPGGAERPVRKSSGLNADFRRTLSKLRPGSSRS